MKHVNIFILAGFLLAGCGRNEDQPPERLLDTVAPNTPMRGLSLVESRRGFKTKLVKRESEKEPIAEPPPQFFRTVSYDSQPGKLAAYLTPDPNDGKTHPAIIWITGGDCNTIGDVWNEASASNDQSACAFRKAGIVMMFPSLRGGNDNPGEKEGFLGEVDDVLAAADFLLKQEFVDPNRIYLGGHSSGGTLVLLVAEYSDRFRAVFSFGPTSKVVGYDLKYLPFDTSSNREFELRAPIRWLHFIKSPVFVFEGTEEPCNLDSLQAMDRTSKNRSVHFFAVRGVNHFNILAPLTQFIASRVLKDIGPTSNLAFTDEELKTTSNGRSE